MTLSDLGRTLPAERSSAVLAGAVEQLARELAQVRTAMTGGDDPELATRLEVADEELRVVGEEVALQAAALEAAVTARRREALLTRQLVAGLPVPLLSTDSDGSVLETNAAGSELLGVDAARLRRKPLFAYVADGSRREARLLASGAVRTHTAAEATLQLTPRHRAPLTCRVTVVPVVAETVPQSPIVLHWVLEPVGQETGDEEHASRVTLVELCRLGIGDAGLRGLLTRVAELTCDGLPGVDAVSVLLGSPDDPGLVTSTSPEAQTAEGLQHAAGAGPVFDAWATSRTIVTPDLSTDPAWPALSREPVRRLRLRGCVAVPLVVDGRRTGVLTLYTDPADRRPGWLGQLGRSARPYVAAAQTLVRDSHVLEEMVVARDQLKTALASRATIDQAIGIVMAKRSCSAQDAFAVLVRISNLNNRKVRDLAEEIVRNTARPAG